MSSVELSSCQVQIGHRTTHGQCVAAALVCDLHSYKCQALDTLWCDSLHTNSHQQQLRWTPCTNQTPTSKPVPGHFGQAALACFVRDTSTKISCNLFLNWSSGTTWLQNCACYRMWSTVVNSQHVSNQAVSAAATGNASAKLITLLAWWSSLASRDLMENFLCFNSRKIRALQFVCRLLYVYRLWYQRSQRSKHDWHTTLVARSGDAEFNQMHMNQWLSHLR